MSGTEFDRKARVVATAWEVIENDDRWKSVLEHYNLGFPFAHLHVEELGTLKAEGKKQVTETYDFMLKALGLEEDDRYYSFWDLIRAYNKEA